VSQDCHKAPPVHRCTTDRFVIQVYYRWVRNQDSHKASLAPPVHRCNTGVLVVYTTGGSGQSGGSGVIRDH